jgi:hypothetical protein
MAALLLLVFLAVVVVDVWAAIAVIFKPGLTGWLVASYWFALVLTLVTTISMTGYF